MAPELFCNEIDSLRIYNSERYYYTFKHDCNENDSLRICIYELKSSCNINQSI